MDRNAATQAPSPDAESQKEKLVRAKPSRARLLELLQLAGPAPRTRKSRSRAAA
jgi:hypothetical protein